VANQSYRRVEEYKSDMATTVATSPHNRNISLRSLQNQSKHNLVTVKMEAKVFRNVGKNMPMILHDVLPKKFLKVVSGNSFG
jgi:hypothetical protein